MYELKKTYTILKNNRRTGTRKTCIFWHILKNCQVWFYHPKLFSANPGKWFRQIFLLVILKQIIKKLFKAILPTKNKTSVILQCCFHQNILTFFILLIWGTLWKNNFNTFWAWCVTSSELIIEFIGFFIFMSITFIYSIVQSLYNLANYVRR